MCGKCYYKFQGNKTSLLNKVATIKSKNCPESFCVLKSQKNNHKMKNLNKKFQVIKLSF